MNLAYNNDPKVKQKYVNRMIAHRKADEVIQGEGFNNGRGCAIGCTLDKYDHNAWAIEICGDDGGEHVELGRLVDGIFESLPKDKAPQFAQDVLEAIPHGADLSLVTTEFKLWLLKDKEHGVYKYADSQGKKAINQVAGLLRRKIAGVKVRQKSWVAARVAARTADEDTAEDATWDAASAAASAAAGVTVGHTAGDGATFFYAARDAQATKLLELLKNAPVKQAEEL